VKFKLSNVWAERRGERVRRGSYERKKWKKIGIAKEKAIKRVWRWRRKKKGF